MPKLSTNLHLVSKLSYNANYKVIFLPSCCFFQDKDSGLMIGQAKQGEGLYYLRKYEKIPVARWNQLLTCLSESHIPPSTLFGCIITGWDILFLPLLKSCSLLCLKTLILDNFIMMSMSLPNIDVLLFFLLVITDVLLLLNRFIVIFGVHQPFQMFLRHASLFRSLMIAQGLHGSFFLNLNLM